MTGTDPARKTHLFACAYCRYTAEIGRSEPVLCPDCNTAAGTYRILDLDDLAVRYSTPSLGPA